MNCKQVEQLLPLYTGQDLDTRRTWLVRVHLQTCSDCAAVALEYGDVREWFRDFTPPVFSEKVYTEVRQRVLRKVEAESTAPFSQIIFSLFQQRIAWAVATAVIVAVMALALYVVASRSTGSHEIANKQPVEVHPLDYQRDSGSIEPKQTRPDRSLAGNYDEQKAGVIKERRRRKSRVHAGDRSVGVVAENGSSATVSRPMRLIEYDPADPEKELRMEIQTRDPNIRIIWFSLQEPKSVVPNRKGT